MLRYIPLSMFLVLLFFIQELNQGMLRDRHTLAVAIKVGRSSMRHDSRVPCTHARQHDVICSHAVLLVVRGRP